MKIAACVILYNPQQSVESNINSYQLVEKIYILDNSNAPHINRFPSLTHQSKITYIHNGLNEGISKRLNQACTLAIEAGFDYLLTMDQDSYFDEMVLTTYFKCIHSFKEREKVSMFGINHEENIVNAGCVYEECKSLITSGSIIDLKTFREIGPFDENLFIDFVDAEYCFRSIEKGFKIIKFLNIPMHHSLGEIQTRISLKNLKPSKRSFHSPARLYYMLRNILYVQSTYKRNFKKEITEYKKDLLNRIKNNLLYKNNKVQTIRMLLKALKDYKNQNMGKLQG